jgi:PKD repeat protein
MIVIISPALLGSDFKCVAVSNPSVATARIDQFEPAAPRVGEVVQATASGNGTPPLEFTWDFGDRTVVHGAQAVHVYDVPGSFLVTLTVRDSLGHAARDSVEVIVSPRVTPFMPAVVMTSDASVNHPVEFVALSFEANTDVLSHQWTFSDGQSGIGSQITAIFPTAGIHRASVTVTNDAGAIAVAEIVFDVVDTAR